MNKYNKYIYRRLKFGEKIPQDKAKKKGKIVFCSLESVDSYFQQVDNDLYIAEDNTYLLDQPSCKVVGEYDNRNIAYFLRL